MPRVELPTVQPRSCGPCRACCDVLAIREIDKPERTPCPHAADTPAGGCGAYDSRPTECRTYTCLWAAGVIPGDDRRRPDNLGVIFDLGSSLPFVVVCREVSPGSAATEAVKYQIDRLAKDHVVYVMYAGTKRDVFGPPAAVSAILSKHREEKGLV
jgi:hypothetical protein